MKKRKSLVINCRSKELGISVFLLFFLSLIFSAWAYVPVSSLIDFESCSNYSNQIDRHGIAFNEDYTGVSDSFIEFFEEVEDNKDDNETHYGLHSRNILLTNCYKDNFSFLSTYFSIQQQSRLFIKFCCLRIHLV